MPLITLKKFHERQLDLQHLQRILQSVPQYSKTMGETPVPERLIKVVPPGINRQDKFVMFIVNDEKPVGCVDLIRGYPKLDTVFVGLFLLIESCQKKGIGHAAWNATEKYIQGWKLIKMMRLGVAHANRHVIPFWRKMGFFETGETQLSCDEGREIPCVMMEKFNIAATLSPPF